MIRTIKPEAANIRTNAGKFIAPSPVIVTEDGYNPSVQRLRTNAGKVIVTPPSVITETVYQPTFQAIRKNAGKQVNRYPFDGTITTSGLIASYDFSILSSYPGIGSAVYNAINPSMYNGTLNNSPSFSSDFGGALNLVRASNQSILLGEILDEVFTFINGTFSFEVWVKFNTLNNDTIYAFFTKNGDGNFGENQRQISFQAINRTTQSYGGIRLDFVYFGDLNGTNIKGVRSNTATLTTGQVYHLVATFDNSVTTNNGMDRVQFYVNSVNQARTLWLNNGSHTAIANGTARLGMGGQYGTSAGPINTIDGQVYAFSIYNKVLSSSEVTYNWNGKRNRFGL